MAPALLLTMALQDLRPVKRKVMAQALKMAQPQSQQPSLKTLIAVKTFQPRRLVWPAQTKIRFWGKRWLMRRVSRWILSAMAQELKMAHSPR